MKISYGICVCNEEIEIKNLLTVILDNKRDIDEIVILLDEPKCSIELKEYLSNLAAEEKIKLTVSKFNNNFSNWKNELNNNCRNDWIINLDPDETITPVLIRYLPVIIEQCEQKEIECVVFGRYNTVIGITQEDIDKWGWWVSQEGYINPPDYQYRLYKNCSHIKWHGKVHERVSGFKKLTVLNHQNPDLVIHHVKTIDKQRFQNNLYNNI